MKKASLIVAGVAAFGLLLVGCGQAPEENTGSSGDATNTAEADSDTAGAEFTACMVSDAGGFDDKSFNQSGYEGLEAAKADFGIAIDTKESKNQNDYADNINGLVAKKCGVIFTVGYLLADATKAAGEANPDAKFGIIDDNSITLPNVKPLIFRTSEAAYLAGYVAAATSKSGIVGTYGGMQIPTVAIFMDGFADGVAKYNADKGKNVKLLGWDKASEKGSFTGDFDDAAKGQSITQTFIDQGADVIMPVAGPVGNGTVAAVKDAVADGKEIAIVWVDADGYETTPDAKALFLTSVVKEIGAAVKDTTKAALDNKFDATPYIGTLENGGVSIASFHDWDSKVSAETKAEVEALKAKIISGEIKVESKNNP